MLARIEAEFPAFELREKSESRFMKFLDILLRIITFNRMKRFMDGFVTTVGETVYVPVDWEERDYTSRAVTMRHEAVHIRQKQKWGAVWFTVKYLIWPLPTLFAWGRYSIEREAYAESLRAWSDFGRLDIIKSSEYRAHTVGHFMGASYFWAWPWRKSVENWYDTTVDRIVAARTTN